ncbi:MAG: hypothetical protein AAF409_08485 [Pseudomonadota bacterium]
MTTRRNMSPADGLGHIRAEISDTIPDDDAEALVKMGVARVYTPKDFELNHIMEDIVGLVGETTREAA